jgi:hypothetical protein
MKHNVFVEVEDGGRRAVGLQNTEEEMIRDIDERSLPLEKLIATRFIAFLGDRRLNLEKLKALPLSEQARLKKEFRGD